MNKQTIFSGLAIIGFLCQSCGTVPIEQTDTVIIRDIKSPASHESAVSNLFTGTDDQVYLTWVETTKDTINTLYYSLLEDTNWQQPVEIASGNNWIVNWADFPSLTQFGKNSLAANYLVETNRENYAYDVHLITSNDLGKSWNQPFVAHKDSTQTEHGFVSLVPYKDDTFMAIWLDGRMYASGQNQMTLRSAIINKEGQILQKFVLDEKVCDCCGTNAITTQDGIVVVYRDRSEEEVRDISLVSFKDGKWSEPKSVASDNWEIRGCPVNGPAIEANGNNLAVAWFSGANDTALVKVAFSSDAGNSFTEPFTVNTKFTKGRIDLCYINENTVVLSWMEGTDKDFYIKARAVKTDGSGVLGDPIIVSNTVGSRSSGFPKMVRRGNDLLFTWTDVGEFKSIKTAVVSVSSFN